MRVALLATAAAMAAVSILLLPQNMRLSVAIGGAVLAFGVYALRQGATQRRVTGMLRQLHDGECGRSAAISEALAELHAQAAALRHLSSVIDDVRLAIDRIGTAQDRHAASHVAGVDQLRDRLTEVEASMSRPDARQAAGREFRQTEALLGLHTTFRVRAPLPPSRGWAASPDVLLYLASLVLDRHPHVIVELGSGLSTIWLAYAVERSGPPGRLIALEHNEEFAARTRAQLALHGLASLAEVRESPLADIQVAGDVWPWYDPTSLADVEQCDLLFVDGPPGNVRERARYPALPLMAARLAEHAVVVLDDYIRPDEKDVVATWREEYPEWELEILDHEKGTAVLSR